MAVRLGCEPQRALVRNRGVLPHEGTVTNTMLTMSTKKKLALGLAFTATLGATLAGGSAQADPKQYSAAVGVGSDTVQDVMNALSGSTNGVSYTPINSGSASGSRQEISFDATLPTGVGDTCITTKLNGPTFTRPNGSGAGRKALAASSGHNPGGWTGSAIGTTPICATAVDITGQVDFARSSSVSSSVVGGATAMTYVPFGRDGVSFAYYKASGSPVTSLTRAQLTQIFTATGPVTIGGTRIAACGIQTSSGTFSFWNGVTTATAAQEDAATAECNNITGALLRSEENDGTALKTRGDAEEVAHPGTEVIIGFSAASFIAKSNNVALGAPPATVGIGSISDNGTGTNLGSPVSGTAPNLAPTAGFFGDATFGRNVYVVLPTTVATGVGNAAIKALFVGPTSAICSATTTINLFGFLASPTCGSTTTTSGYDTGAS